MMSSLLGDNWATMLNMPATASFDIMTILAVGGSGIVWQNSLKLMPCKQPLFHSFLFYRDTIYDRFHQKALRSI